jgi:hypothetical protein
MVIKANSGSKIATAPINAQRGTPVQNCLFLIWANKINPPEKQHIQVF